MSMLNCQFEGQDLWDGLLVLKQAYLKKGNPKMWKMGQKTHLSCSSAKRPFF
jgi:hypothetical protein